MTMSFSQATDRVLPPGAFCSLGALQSLDQPPAVGPDLICFSISPGAAESELPTGSFGRAALERFCRVSAGAAVPGL